MKKIGPSYKKFYLHNTWIEIKRRKCYFSLSFLSVFIVVAATTVTNTISQNAPIIFLTLAENNSGEIDIEIYANYLISGYNETFPEEFYLNHSRISSILDNSAEVTSKISSPRFLYSGKLYGPLFNTSCTNELLADISTTNEKLYDFFSYTACSYTEVEILIIDTELERSMEVGREYLEPELGFGEAYVTENIQQTFGEDDFTNIIINFEQIGLLSNLIEKYSIINYGNISYDLQSFHMTELILPLTVKNVIPSNLGKLNKDTTSVVILEFKHFLSLIGQHIPMDFQETFNYVDFSNFVTSLNPYEYAQTVVINFQPNRLDYYLQSDYDHIQDTVTKEASLIAEALGVHSVYLDLKTMIQLYPLKFGGVFLGISMNVIVTIIFFLSVVLIFNLLLVSVDTRTYEFAMLRVLGMKKFVLTKMVLVQALSFVIPAIIAGLIFSVPCIIVVSKFFEKKLNVSIPYFPNAQSVFIGIFIGFLIPLISSLIPIRVALQQSLSSSLDQSRSKTSAVNIKISEGNKGFPWKRVTFSTISIAIAMSIYYFLPLALLTFNLSLFLAIFFWILMGLLVGVVTAAMNIQFLLCQFIVKTTLFWERAPIKTLVLKNMIAHVKRNRRTTLMYSVSIAIIIFIFISYELQTQTAIYSKLSEKGCYVGVDSYWPESLDYNSIESILKKEEIVDLIETHGWVTTDLADATNNSIQITHKGNVYTYWPSIYGVSPSLYEIGLTQFLTINNEDENSGLSLSEQLYTARGMQSAIIGKTYADFLNIDFDNETTILLKIYDEHEVRSVELRVLAILSSSPFFSISDKPDQDEQDIILSMPTFINLLGDKFGTSMSDLPLARAKIKPKSSSEAVISSISKVLNDYSTTYGYSVWDFSAYKKQIESNQSVINGIFIGVAVIAMFLCLFSLISTMTANMLEQTKEIAVLRALGFNRFQMIKVYIYESYTLVFSSCLCGFVTGGIVGYVMTAQQVLFTTLPLTFVFPTEIFFTTFGVSIVCAILSTLFPAKSLMKNPISVLTRMV